MNYVDSKTAKQILNVTNVTLFKWKKSGKIKVKEISQRKVLYDVDSVQYYKAQNSNKMNVIYSDRHIDEIKSYMIKNGIKVDKIYNEFNALFNDISYNLITSVYCFNKNEISSDYEKIEYIFNLYNVNIEILDKSDF